MLRSFKIKRERQNEKLLPVHDEWHCAHHGRLEDRGVALVALQNLGGHVGHRVRRRVANL